MSSSTATQPEAVAKTAWIIVNTPDGHRDVYEITPDNNLIIGSSPNCSVRINDQSVSSMHCLVSLQGGRLSVQDWYTAAGTFLNGQRINEPAGFAPGDQLQIGEYHITAEFDESQVRFCAPTEDDQPEDSEPSDYRPGPTEIPDSHSPSFPAQLFSSKPEPSAPEDAAREFPVESTEVAEVVGQAFQPAGKGRQECLPHVPPESESTAAPTLKSDEPAAQSPRHADDEPSPPSAAYDEPEPPAAESAAPASPDGAPVSFYQTFDERALNALTSAEPPSSPPQDEPPTDALEAIRALRSEADDGEIDSLRLRVTELELENEELRHQVSSRVETDLDDAADPFDREMLELLKAEVEELQSDVAQREERIAQLEAGGPAADPDADSEEMTALVDRLETMLAELEASDARNTTMQDLLSSAEEATRAEQEEREQLSAWVSDIEEKISQREAEWQAQQNVLKEQVQKLTAQREKFDEQLRDLTRRQGTTAQAQLVTELRAEIQELNERLEASEQTCRNLRKQIDDVEFQKNEEGQKARVEELLREERLQMAQERAEVTRERAELSKIRAEMEVIDAVESRGVDEASARVRAFREHLKDIHNKDTGRKGPERPTEKAGLASRLSRLWKRLDG